MSPDPSSVRDAKIECPPILGLTAGRKVLVVLGEGGVGKTTVACGIGLLWASRGKRVLVITADPSRRLRTALGLSGASGKAEPVPVSGPGSMYAMVVEASVELRTLVERLVEDGGLRRRILDSPFFSKVAVHLAGTHEYTAMLRLAEAIESGRYDTVVLDTPPSKQAYDLLDSPKRLHDLLSSDVFRLFVGASSGVGRLGLRALKGKGVILKGMGRFVGEKTFLDFLDFLLAFDPLFEQVGGRAARLLDFLRSRQCGAVVVCRPSFRDVEVVRSFARSLADRGIEPILHVVNKVVQFPAWNWPCPDDGGRATVAGVARMKDLLTTHRALSLYSRQFLHDVASLSVIMARRYTELAQAHSGVVRRLAEAVSPVPVLAVGLMDSDVAGRDSLKDFQRCLAAAQRPF